ncbi:MAG: hypothetical protein ABI834_03855 [Ginsengibacter sp.]
MSIDNIPLHNFLYQNFFEKNLVDLKANTADNILNQIPDIIFFGGNQKKIIIVFNNSQNKFLGDIQMKFLDDILTACGLTISDVALVNIFHRNITHYQLMMQLHPKKVLIFGIPSNNLDLPFNIPFFQIQNFQEQVFMLSPSIEELQMNTELKKSLWECLQKIFNI